MTEPAFAYAEAITPHMAALIDSADAADPIARQFVPSPAEALRLPEECGDPIGDAAHTPLTGLVHRHADRVLFKPTLTCPVYCRFCFRREVVGQGTGNLSPQEIAAACDYVRARPEITEVIFTGGDPLILSPRRVAGLSEAFAAIPHVQVLRWHTRVPCVDPARVDAALVAALKVRGAVTYVALHANHPREFTAEACAAIARLVDAGIPMLSQSVLLKGINADLETLEALMRGFIANRIRPYYLHHPDLVPGTSHLRLSIDEGRALYRALAARVSGIALPAYVLDLPGGYAKVPLLSDNVEALGEGRWRLRDHHGRWHLYPPQPL